MLVREATEIVFYEYDEYGKERVLLTLLRTPYVSETEWCKYYRESVDALIRKYGQIKIKSYS